MLVLCVTALLRVRWCVFFSVPAFSMLQQGYENLSCLTHFEPKLGIAAVAAGVSASASRVAFDPPASQLVAVCEKGSCKRRRNLQKTFKHQEVRTIH